MVTDIITPLDLTGLLRDAFAEAETALRDYLADGPIQDETGPHIEAACEAITGFRELLDVLRPLCLFVGAIVRPPDHEAAVADEPRIYRASLQDLSGTLGDGVSQA